MAEPRRLLEDAESGAERALLQAGMSYRSSRDTWTKTMTALGLAGSTTIVAGTASAAASVSASSASTPVAASVALTPVAKMTTAKVLLALSALGAAVAVPVGYQALRAGGHATDGRVQVAAGTRARAPELAMASPSASVAAGMADEEALAASKMADGEASRARGPARGPVASVTLTQELAALDAARSVLARGDAQAALFLLDGYDRACRHGKLEVEAELLRMDALAKNGETREARRRAAQFLKRHPDSLLASRARTYLGQP